MINIKKYCFRISLTLILGGSVLLLARFQLVPSIWAIVLPNLAFMYLFWQLTIDKPIPIKYIIMALMFGFISIVGSAVGQVAIGILINPLFSSDVLGIFNTIVVAPFTEEILKGFVILWVYFRSHKTFGVTHGLAYAGLTSFMFAMGEQVLFSITGNSDGVVNFWENQYFISTIYFGLGHGIMTGFIALSCAKASLHKSLKVKRWLPWGGLISAILFHGIYNYAIVYDATHGDMISLVVTTIIYSLMVLLFVLLLGLVLKEYFTMSQKKNESV